MSRIADKTYNVTLDVFFMDHVTVTAKNEKEAIEKAKDSVCYGMGEEVTLYEIEELSDESQQQLSNLIKEGAMFGSAVKDDKIG
jgi:hypothetical protein